MRVHVKFFAIFRELRGVNAEWKDLAENTTIEQLWRGYAALSPQVADIRAAFAVNQILVKPAHVLQDGDEVAFLPPVSGGAKQPARAQVRKGSEARKKSSPYNVRHPKIGSDVSVTRRSLNLVALIKRVAFPGAGAIVTFSGVVRNNAYGKKVDHLEYEAYPEMAEQTMGDILGEIHARWADVRVSMAHRIGRLEIGEASLIIVVAAPHRAEAYAASRYAIERVKGILPVWKKEFASDGEYWVDGPVAGELRPENAESTVHTAERTGE
jgi:MoaE-MoaD fusion protein